mmetsp:Transcript_125397/g.297731  ORF Transcript_125397/g.297731 Transcript_125397/m.297731 type:complete len:480 (-) Transcript_125397:246-1685(-)
MSDLVCLLAFRSLVHPRFSRPPAVPAVEDALNQTAPYYLRAHRNFPDPLASLSETYAQLEEDSMAESSRPVGNQSVWVLPDKLLASVRNHDSLVLEVGERQFLVNVLGRWSRKVQVTDLATGQQWSRRSFARDPSGDRLADLNHVYTVLVDKLGSPGKEVWMSCGFRGDEVNWEYSIKYARILDLDSLELRVGPRLPYAGGACTATALEIIKGEPPMICSFGGTDGHHDSGLFLPYASCYDRLRERFWFPFGRMPYGLDHGNVALLPRDRCGAHKATLLILNYRTESYGISRPEILAFDLPDQGWTLEELSNMSKEDLGNWWLYHNVSYTDAHDDRNCPRDASGIAVANDGRYILNFGGVYRPSRHVVHTYSVVRKFDVCSKEWQVVDDLGIRSFALQSAASQKLQLAITCGGQGGVTELFEHHNSPWCIAFRPDPASGLVLANRHGDVALRGFPAGFVPGQLERPKSRSHAKKSGWGD